MRSLYICGLLLAFILEFCYSIVSHSLTQPYWQKTLNGFVPKLTPLRISVIFYVCGFVCEVKGLLFLQGIFISKVNCGGIAEKEGLLVGDKILSVGYYNIVLIFC